LPAAAVLGEKPLQGVVILGLIAWVAGDSEIAHAIGASAAFGMDVLNFQTNIRAIAIGAPMSPLQQEIFADFVAE
jgi:hypothetical protein